MEDGWIDESKEEATLSHQTHPQSVKNTFSAVTLMGILNQAILLPPLNDAMSTSPAGIHQVPYSCT